jgi:hypothetical protein
MFYPTYLNRPMQIPEAIFTVWRDEFLGMSEWGGLFDLTCHPQITGHPSRLLMLRKLIRYIKEHDGCGGPRRTRSPSTGSVASAAEGASPPHGDACSRRLRAI